ncbi:CO/xanthine dehydrogenase FAD-binding subunit [Duganella sp. 1224]|uniref:FAD binding domain-containing protein n=1 Tax=Duganella sp. 1224 TaxID=2587052 RepID=UPI0015CA687D|nr:FAD binding domain-containing protein [Duganella sp. 1224]NYE59649.1 CO/xanthine dehydrogenase FAD-binding subunit [Duganella sp. 1224]
MNYLRARTIEEVLHRLSAQPQARIVCGATDLFADPALAPGKVEWVDISRVEALRAIARRDGMVRIGAAATWDQIAATAWLPAALRQAAESVGSRQIRVQGSIGGNLCHASPVADGVPPLLALDAQVELASERGVRRLPLAEFLLGRRRTALRADELLLAVCFPVAHERERTAFVKYANRDGMAIAVVSAAVRVAMSSDGHIEKLAVSVGGVSEVPLRLRALETALEGRHRSALAPATRELVTWSPIDDCRASAAHRLHVAPLAIERAFNDCIKESGHGGLSA